MTIKRIWHGYTARARADDYEALLKAEVIKGIERKKIPGFRRIEVLRRPLEDEVEFITVMEFDSLDSVSNFVGQDYETAYVPDEARAILSRFDERAQHYELRESRSYGEATAIIQRLPTTAAAIAEPILAEEPLSEEGETRAEPVPIYAEPQEVASVDPLLHEPAHTAADTEARYVPTEPAPREPLLHPDTWFVRKNNGRGSVPVTSAGYKVGAKFVFSMFGWALVAIAMAIVGLMSGPQWLPVAAIAIFVIGALLSAWYFIGLARKHTDYAMTYDDFLKLQRQA